MQNVPESHRAPSSAPGTKGSQRIWQHASLRSTSICIASVRHSRFLVFVKFKGTFLRIRSDALELRAAAPRRQIKGKRREGKDGVKENRDRGKKGYRERERV